MNALPPLFLAALLLTLGASSEAAPIYRIEVPGQPPLFTDRPAQLATPEAELGAASAFPAPPAAVPPQPAQASAAEMETPPSSEAVPAPAIGIASPGAGEALRANGGLISLALTASPPLNQGEALWVYLDDAAPQITTQLTLTLTEVARGEHRLRVERRRGQQTLAQAEQTFYVLRTALGQAPP